MTTDEMAALDVEMDGWLTRRRRWAAYAVGAVCVASPWWWPWSAWALW